MTELKSIFNSEFIETLEQITKEGIENAAKGFSGMLGKTLEVKKSSARLVNILEITHLIGGPEDETVAIYLRAEGSIAGQMMLVLQFESAMELVDLLMGEAIGSTKKLETMEKSALQELGNVTGTYFLNSVSEITGSSVRPTPPAVMVDMFGAIIDIVIVTTGGEQEEVLLIEAEFVLGKQIAEIQFWVIPDPASLKTFEFKY